MHPIAEAAAEIETLRNKTNRWSKYTLDELISQCDLLASVTPANMPTDRAVSYTHLTLPTKRIV